MSPREIERKTLHCQLLEEFSDEIIDGDKREIAVEPDPSPEWYRGRYGARYPLRGKLPNMRVLERAHQFDTILRAIRANTLLFRACLRPDVTIVQLRGLHRIGS